MATGFNPCTALTGWTEPSLYAGDQFTLNSGGIYATTASIESFKYDAIDSDAERQDTEILLKYRTGTWNSTHYIGITRGSDSGTATSQAGYFVALRSTAIRTYYKNSGGSLTQIASTTKTLLASTDYWVRFRVNSTTIRARVWADGDSEPGTWDCDSTDTAGPGVVDGYAGLHLGNNTSHWWYGFGYGTAGDTAPASAGGGDVAIAVAVGSLSIAGTAPAAAATANVAASPGSGSALLEASAPTCAVTGHVEAQPAAAGLLLSGHAPTAMRTESVTLSPAAAALAVTAAAPISTSTAHVTASPASAALAVTTSTATLAATDSVTAQPGAGAITVTVEQPVVVSGGATVLQPGIDALAVTGNAPTVAATNNVRIVGPVVCAYPIADDFVDPDITFSSGPDAYPLVDDVVLDDADYIEFPNNFDKLQFSFGPLPEASGATGTVDLHIRASATSDSGVLNYNIYANIDDYDLGVEPLASTYFSLIPRYPITLSKNVSAAALKGNYDSLHLYLSPLAMLTGRLYAVWMEVQITTALAVASHAPSVMVDVKASPASTALVVTPETAITIRAETAQPNIDALVVSASAPALAATDNRTAQPGVVAITVTPAQPVSVSGGSVVSQPDADALVVTTAVPSLAVTAVVVAQPGSGSAVIAGASPAAAATSNHIAQPGYETLEIAGNSPSVSSAVTIATGVGSISVSTSAPQVMVGVFVQPESTSALIGTLAPVVAVTALAVVEVANDDLVITTYAPGIVGTSLYVAPGDGEVVIDPYPPSVWVSVRGRLLGSPVARPACGGDGRIGVGVLSSGIRIR